ncbi:MAG: hypothetical protein NC342_01820 [Pseudoflavonifractor sp.]|nr:hypothetical protein [Alloprevotella sp.]MCM1116261.1 hypothetical protein [Pseudoflavonifractor sp.]
MFLTLSCPKIIRDADPSWLLTAFEDTEAEISEDFHNIPSSKGLMLPMDYNEGSKIIEEQYVGKTLRVVARSPEGSNRFGGRYYLFVIED